MTAEDWKPVAGFPDYWVSNTGRIVSRRRKKPYEMRGSRNQDGYRMVLLTAPNGTKTMRAVHRLVAEAFIGPLPAGLQTRHLDGIKDNCSASNLTYGTPSRNMLDQVEHGVHNMARKTHCKRGHQFDPDNTYVTPSGSRACRACVRLSRRRQAFRAAGIPA